MNTYDDVMRRLLFMRREILVIHHNETKYHLVIGRGLFVDFLNDAPEVVRADHNARQSHLVGYRLSFHERLNNYLALVHEVRG